MSAVNPNVTPLAIQEGYRAIALDPDSANSSLRLCLVLKDTPDPVGGLLVAIGETADASVYLGCVTDAAGQVREWLEVWVQNLDNLERRFPAHVPIFCNELLDRQWVQRAEHWWAANPDAFIVTGWERQHPLPLFLTMSLEATVHPRDAQTNEPWRLATDDNALLAAGLPAFSTSLARYLTNGGENARFIPVTQNAPLSEKTVDIKTALGNIIPVNPTAGLLMVRSLASLELMDWFRILSGAAWRGLEHGKKPFRLHGVYRTLQNEEALRQGAGHFLLAPQGRAGRLLETFHLKLQTLRSAIALARDWVARQQVPFLNLRAESFRVRLGETDTQLPFLWNSITTLAVPGEAIALPVETTDARYFAPAEAGASVYRPQAGSPVRGMGTLRVRDLTQGDNDLTVLEGTLTTQERIAVAANDLLCLRFALPSGRLELYGKWDATEALSSNELRFRTLPRKLSAAVLTSLRETGVAIPHVTFETLPVLSTPCDLHALGVIGVQALLASGGGGLTLPLAVDEVFSLAAKVNEKGADAAHTLTAIRSILEEDQRWQTNLGPHHLLADPLSPEDGEMLFPADLWWATIAVLMRFFPGLTPSSYCKDLGDAPALALERAFDEPLAHLDNLLVRSRSLISIDWNMNREIRTVVDQLLSRA